LGQYTQDKRHIKIDTPLGKDALLLQGFNGEEGVSRPFHFDLRMHSENRAIAFASIVGKMATVSMLLPDQSIRYINGVIQSFAQGGTTTINTGQNTATFATYFATLVPWLSLLRHTSDCRIFQEKSVPDIIEQIFKDAGFSDFQLKLQDSYQKREYCVQWNETDLNFVSRLMEEEGIFYFFEHTKDKHLLILADRATEFKPCPLAASASYAVRQGSANQLGRVTEWHMSQDIRPGKYEIRDYGFEKPTFQLAASVSGKDPRKYEVYYYPGEFQKANDGERLVGIRMEEEETPLSQIRGSSSCQGFIPGYRFDLKDHYRKDISDKAYTLVGVYHSSDQGTNYLATATRTEDDLDYVNHFQCIPHPTPFRPPRLTSTPLMRGTQTAIVVGPAGEEIHVDKYGRVKVQFHWDREGKYDEHSSCWVRVSQPVAGKGWGAMWIPRIGQEVIVDFLDGDPDRPIITGRVYNAESMPPYTLPDEKTKSTLKSYSSKGGGGFNEIQKRRWTFVSRMTGANGSVVTVIWSSSVIRRN
jgi:type VI secretion system secreted protein VgrG